MPWSWMAVNVSLWAVFGLMLWRAGRTAKPAETPGAEKLSRDVAERCMDLRQSCAATEASTRALKACGERLRASIARRTA